MIRGIHGMFYSREAEALRAFLRDKLGLPAVDVGEGWLIFPFAAGELGCHPTSEDGTEGPPSGTHSVALYCDDIEGTVRDLRSRGVEFDDEITDRGYGLVIHLTMPGGVELELYEPRYDTSGG